MSDFEHKAKDFGGKAKEAFGDATGNEQLESEGRRDQGEAAAESFKQKVSDVGEKLGEGARDAADKAKGFIDGLGDDDKK